MRPIALAVLLGLTFGPHLAGDWMWDDVYLVQHNPHFGSWSGLLRLVTWDLWRSAGMTSSDLYHPIPMAYLFGLCSIFGKSVVALRIFNLILHGSVCLLFGQWLERCGPKRATATFAILSSSAFRLFLAVRTAGGVGVVRARGANDGARPALCQSLGGRRADRGFGHVRPALILGLGLPGPFRHSGRVAGGLALLVAALAFAPGFEELARLVGRGGELLSATSNLSIPRILVGFGLELPTWLTGALVLLLVGAAWRRCGAGQIEQLVAVGCLASLYWPPRVWLHSLTLLVPVLALVVRRLLIREENSDLAQGSRRALSWLLGGLCILCVGMADAWGELGTLLPGLPWGSALGALMPLISVVWLTREASRARSRSPGG